MMTLASWSVGPSSVGQDAPWLVGPSFQRQLDAPVTIQWSDVPLRSALETLGRTQRMCIWLDRRIDPNYAFDFACQNETMRMAMKRMAMKLGGDVAVLDGVLYVGPRRVTESLATVMALRRDDAARLPERLRVKWVTRQAAQWPMLSTPRELIDQIMDQVDATVANLDSVPHDLWPAMDLPPLAATDRLTLILAGFDLTFRFKGPNSVEFIPWPEQARITRQYQPGGDVARAARALHEAFPQVDVKRQGLKLVVAGRWEDHELIARWLRGERVQRMAGPGETRYTLNIQNQPLGAVLNAIAVRLGYTLRADAELADVLQRRVTFRVDNGTLEQLFDAALKESGIAWQLDGETLVLRRAP